MQYAGTALPVSPGGHLGRAADETGLGGALAEGGGVAADGAGADDGAVAADGFASSHAERGRAKTRRAAYEERMGARA